MLTTIEIGRRIAQARKAKGYSQAQLANHLALSPQAVGKWERGESLPDIITLDRLGELLGVGLAYFSEFDLRRPVASPAEVHPEENSTPEKLPDPVDTKKMEWNFSHSDWRDSDFSGMDNLAKMLRGSNILRCSFADSDLTRLRMSGNNIVETNFNGSYLDEATFKGCNVERDDFSKCSLEEIKFHACKVGECVFDDANLQGAIFSACSFIRCITTNTRWQRTLFKNTQLKGIVFSGELNSCYFENCEFTDVEFRDAQLINTGFKGKGLRKLRFTHCTADNITYAFLKNGNADLSNVTVVH